MHLGNVKFKAQVQRKLGCDVDGCAVVNKTALEVRLPGASFSLLLSRRRPVPLMRASAQLGYPVTPFPVAPLPAGCRHPPRALHLGP